MVVGYGGLGSNKKLEDIRELVKVEKLDMIGIQETKKEVIDRAMINAIWGSPDCNYIYSPSSGASGGITLIWNNDIFTVEDKFIDTNFIGIMGKWNGISEPVVILNVYGPQSHSLKRSLWNSISDLMGKWNAI